MSVSLGLQQEQQPVMLVSPGLKLQVFVCYLLAPCYLPAVLPLVLPLFLASITLR
jgi:hypothetical protein